MEKVLNRMPYAQAKVRDYHDIGRNLVVLQSYRTDVIIVNGNWLRCTGLYSMTTRKHISAFMKEYFPSITYFDVKKLVTDGLEMNVITGEVREVQ